MRLMNLRPAAIFAAGLLGATLTLTYSETAAASEPIVQVIYAIPSDRQHNPRYEAAIRQAIHHVQDWYAGQLTGRTFAIDYPTPMICDIDRPARYYEQEGGWDRVIEAVQHCAPVWYWSEEFVWAIYIDADFDCRFRGQLGRATPGITIIHSGDLEGMLNTDGTYRLCPDFPPRGAYGWQGGLAHELGHSFGLRHQPECDAEMPASASFYEVPDSDPPAYEWAYTGDRCDIHALMWMGFYWDYPATTYLTEEDLAILDESPFIRQPAPQVSTDTFIVGGYHDSYPPGGGFW